MRNFQLIQKTIEDSMKILPMLERMTNEEFECLNAVKEPSGNILQIKITERTSHLVSPISNTIYYMKNANEDRTDYEAALKLRKVYEEKAPEIGEWIVRYYQNGND